MFRYFLLLILLRSSYAKERPTTLEDIERDNTKGPRGPSGSPTNYGFLPTKTPEQYAQQQPSQTYIQPQYIPPQAQYYYQPSYQQYENVQYIAENSLSGYAAQPHQQYYYVQQYTAPSNAIQSVVDPKGGVQYVMYVPAGSYQQQEPGIVYANEQEVQQQRQEEVPNVGHGQREPKSLLDSYVPSILQLQYYRNQHANAIRESYKDVAQVAGIKRGPQQYLPSH